MANVQQCERLSGIKDVANTMAGNGQSDLQSLPESAA
jgi:hypothetical protein